MQPGSLDRLRLATEGHSIGPDPATGRSPAERLAAARESVPQAGDEGLRLLARVGRVDPTSLVAYRDAGGYSALRRAFEIGAEAVIAEVTASKLVGRGGAAFPTGRKWAAVRAAAGDQKYVVCNADESEPGTFKDRALIEADPFALVEAMTIEAFATGASKGYLYLRGEYPLAASRLAHAIAEAGAAGLLGGDILGSGFGFDIELRIAAPAPTSAARRRPSSTRSRARAASRATSRRSRSRSGCSAGRPPSTTSRRWPTSR